MKRILAPMGALIAILLFWTVILGERRAAAADINILPYFVAGNVGDSWTYAFIHPSGIADFTVNLTQVTTGPLAGKYRSGNWLDIIDSPNIRWQIFDWDAGGITIYETESGILSPAVTIAASQKLDVMVNSIPDIDEHVHVIQRLASLKVLAGTFDDVLIDLTLTKRFGPSSANAEFGLDPAAFPYQVTHVVWYAAGIGEIQNRDYEPAPGGDMLFEYQLKATSIVPLPATLVMLGSGLVGLWCFRNSFF